MSRRHLGLLCGLCTVLAYGCADDSIKAPRMVRRDLEEVEENVVFVSDFERGSTTSRRPVRRTMRVAHFEPEAIPLPEHRLAPTPVDVMMRVPDASLPSPVSTPAHEMLRQARAMYTTKLEVIANNLANANTTAFKALRVEFEDCAYDHKTLPGNQDSLGNHAPLGVAVGDGAKVQATQADFSQGKLQQTGRSLDVAIEGHGFFAVNEPNSGLIIFTRAGNFAINSVGQLVVGSANTGRVLNPPITVPPDATAILIGANGTVTYQQSGTTSLSQAGQLQLARFMNPEGLARLGENLYQGTDSSGRATLGTPGQNGMGILRQNSLETSNVDLHQEQHDWTQTTAAIQAIDTLLR